MGKLFSKEFINDIESQLSELVQGLADLAKQIREVLPSFNPSDGIQNLFVTTINRLRDQTRRLLIDAGVDPDTVIDIGRYNVTVERIKNLDIDAAVDGIRLIATDLLGAARVVRLAALRGQMIAQGLVTIWDALRALGFNVRIEQLNQQYGVPIDLEEFIEYVGIGTPGGPTFRGIATIVEALGIQGPLDIAVELEARGINTAQELGDALGGDSSLELILLITSIFIRVPGLQTAVTTLQENGITGFDDLADAFSRIPFGLIATISSDQNIRSRVDQLRTQLQIIDVNTMLEYLQDPMSLERAVSLTGIIFGEDLSIITDIANGAEEVKIQPVLNLIARISDMGAIVDVATDLKTNLNIETFQDLANKIVQFELPAMISLLEAVVGGPSSTVGAKIAPVKDFFVNHNITKLDHLVQKMRELNITFVTDMLSIIGIDNPTIISNITSKLTTYEINTIHDLEAFLKAPSIEAIADIIETIIAL